MADTTCQALSFILGFCLGISIMFFLCVHTISNNNTFRMYGSDYICVEVIDE